MDVDLAAAMIDYARRHKNIAAEKAATARYMLALYGQMRFDRTEMSFPDFLQAFAGTKFKMHIAVHFARVFFQRQTNPWTIR